MAAVKKRWTKNSAKNLVERARYASGNNRYDLKRMPKGHWMRKDAAKQTWKNKKEFGMSRSYKRGIVS